MYEEAKQLIVNAKNICVIPNQHGEPESLTAVLALFYTLKELGKNVNPILGDFPEKLNFLIPSVDFISAPQNFVIAIPKEVADISQIYYEKSDEQVKIHLTVNKGLVKKENIAFYFSQPKPDLVITLGMEDFHKELSGTLDSFAFLLGAPILNIDNHGENKNFGVANIVEKKSLSEMVLGIIKSIDENLIKKNPAECLLAGLVLHYENFKNATTSPETLKVAAGLMEKGADYQKITGQLFKVNEQQTAFLGAIFKNLEVKNNLNVSLLASDAFWNFGEPQAQAAMEKIKTLGMQRDLLVLWKSHASDPMIKGFFQSNNGDTLNKINSQHKDGWAFISIAGEDINFAQQEVITLLS